MMSCVAGSSTAKVLPDLASIHWSPMSSRLGVLSRVCKVLLSAGRSNGLVIMFMETDLLGLAWTVVSCCFRHNWGDAALPFGGYKQSGWGREMGKEAIELYTETKAVGARLV